MTQFNPYLDFLEKKPEAAYFSYADRFGGPRGSQRQRGFSQGQFSDIYSQYLGNLGRQARAGTSPQGTFNDFLGGFDFENWYRQQVPYQVRSQGFSDLVPQTRFINPYYGQRQ